MTKSPKIASVGPPPDKHAERIVGEMLRFMHVQRTRYHRKHAHGLIDVRTMGGRKGQLKTVDKMRNAIGPLLLEIGLKPATRGRFVLITSEWCLWDPKTELPLASDDPAPSGALWLAVTSSTYTGTNYIPKVTTGLALIITYHSLVRLCQRAGVVTVGDMIHAVRKLWFVTDHLMERFDPKSQDWLRPPDGTWLLAMPIEGKPVAVIAPDKQYGDVLIVKTILDYTMARGEGDIIYPTTSGVEEPQTPPIPIAQTG